MRNWTYSYKTSDGIRHEGEISAPTKDAVYSTLRSRGIRAIRVEERIAPVIKKGLRGLRNRDWCALILAVVAISVAMSLAIRYVGAKDPLRSASDPAVEHLDLKAASPEFVALCQEVDKIKDLHLRRLDEVDFELLANYALLYSMPDATAFLQEIAKGRECVREARDGVKAAFASAYPKIPVRNGEELTEAQKAYGIVMSCIDASEERLDNEECAIALLCDNRGKWSVKRGRVVWSDDVLAAAFLTFERSPTAETARWRRDFRHIESNVVGVPTRNAEKEDFPLRESEKNDTILTNSVKECRGCDMIEP